jgi:hypothetical protein
LGAASGFFNFLFLRSFRRFCFPDFFPRIQFNETPRMPRMTRHLVAAIAAIIVGLAYTSGRSFWMDEGGTVFRAMMPTIRDWWAMMLQLKGSDVLMPLYMLYAWFWHQVIGATSEYALRLSNLPWLVLAAVVLVRVRFWPLVCLISPFVLYFVDDFRPYVMQIAAGSCAAAALGRWFDGGGQSEWRGVHAVCASCVFLIACSMTGAVWAAGVAAAAVVAKPDCLGSGAFWRKASPWIAVALAAGGYYVRMMMGGYRATEIENAGFLNLLFGVYEMTGLLGLGPGKEEVRLGLGAVIPHLWLLIPGALCIAAAWTFGVRRRVRESPSRITLAAAAAVLIPLAILAVFGALMDFRVLGRHLSPAIPAILLPIAHCLSSAPANKSLVRVCGALACLAMVVSSLTVRLHPRHAKDDYRSATAMAIKALGEGKRIWWQADMNAARYYAYRHGGMRSVNLIQVLESDPPTGLMFADVVVINRPDLRFRGVDYQSELRRNFFQPLARFPGFEVWETR